MRHVSVREFQCILAHLDEALATEGELVIARHGKPIARLLPPVGAGDIPSRADFRKTMPRLTIGSEVDVRADRDGR